MTEVSIKEKRLLDFMRTNNYAAVVIGRQDNFAWLSCGGHNRWLPQPSRVSALRFLQKKRNTSLLAAWMGEE